MGMFHMSVSAVLRAQDSSSVVSAAYTSRSRIRDSLTGITYDYRRCHRHEVLVADLGVCITVSSCA